MADVAPVVPAPSPAPSLGFVDYVKMLFNGRKAVQEAITQGKIVVSEYHTAGIKTAAFWASLLAGLSAIALQVAGLIAPPWGAIVLAASSFIYAVARGIVKLPDPTAGLKPFASTSEGWLAILSALVTLLSAIKGVVSPQAASVLGSVIAAGVAVSQSLAASGATPDASTAAAPSSVSPTPAPAAPPSAAQGS